jgi:hypothetical protein
MEIYYFFCRYCISIQKHEPRGSKERFMKNVIKAFGIFVLAAMIGVSMTACGGGPETPAKPTSTVFESKDSNGNIYILKVSSASASRAAYTPKNGDSFTLTIITTSGEIWTETGTVTASGTTLTLTGTNTLTVNVSGGGMTAIAVTTGTINVGSVTITTTTVVLTSVPLADPSTIKLVANNQDDAPNNWACGWNLDTITSVTPKKDLKYKFSVSGTTDKTLEKADLVIVAHKNWSDYQWLGSSEQVRLSGTFEKTFLISIVDNPKTGYTIDLILNNNVAAPANAVLNETVLATIKNFELRLIGIEK